MPFLCALILVSGYLLGNLNGAVVVSRVVAKEDVRSTIKVNVLFFQY